MRTKVTTDAVRLGVIDTARCVVGVLAPLLAQGAIRRRHRGRPQSTVHRGRSGCGTVVGQATAGQLRWLRTRMKQAAPQALVVT